jgi:hypothetical protein
MKKAVIALSNGGEVEVVDQALDSYYVIMMNDRLSDEVRQGANLKFNQRLQELQGEVRASLGSDPRAADMVNGKIYVAKGNSYQDDQISINAKNAGEFVTGSAPPLAEFQRESNILFDIPGGAANLVAENPLTATALTGTGLLLADQIAGRTLDGVKPTFDAQTDPDAPNVGKSRSFRIPEGGTGTLIPRGDSKFLPQNYFQTNPGGLPNLTSSNYSKVLQAMPDTPVTPDQIGLEGQSAGAKPLNNALQATDPNANKALNLQRFYNIESPLYTQQTQGKVTGPRVNIDGDAIVASQQKQLPSTSYIKNRFKKIGSEEVDRIRANQPKNLKNASRPTSDPDEKKKTRLPRGTGLKATAALATPAIMAASYNALTTNQRNRDNQEQYDLLKNILENNAVEAGTGQRLYSPADIEEAMQLYEELLNAGAIKMQ